MGAEATFRRDASSHKLVTAAALASGEVQQLADGRAAFFEGLDAAAINDTVSLRKEGIVEYKCASGVTFSLGDPVYWDVANNTAVTLASAAAGDWYLGRATKAKASGELVVRVDTNALGEAQCRGEGKLYVNVAASAAVTNTTVETAFDKTYSIPASKLKAGDMLRIRVQGIATATNSTDTLTIKLKFGTTVIVATAAVDVANNDIFVIDVIVILRTVPKRPAIHMPRCLGTEKRHCRSLRAATLRGEPGHGRRSGAGVGSYENPGAFVAKNRDTTQARAEDRRVFCSGYSFVAGGSAFHPVSKCARTPRSNENASNDSRRGLHSHVDGRSSGFAGPAAA